MRDVILKLRLLWRWMLESFGEWKSEVWDRDLDEQYCCDGTECACAAESVRDVMCSAYGFSHPATEDPRP